jgi:hypothetical protein
LASSDIGQASSGQDETRGSLGRAEPNGAFSPLSTISLTIPAGAGGLKAKDGSTLAAPVSYSWNVQDGSVLRLQELLATLGYLPVTWAATNFERVSGLPVDGVTSAALWTKHLQAAEGPTLASNTGGYTYALVSKANPETMTVWHNGAVAVQTAVNTGIAGDPTVDGTFPVYEHLASQVMSGTNPGGSHYADPVSWVAYFNGGDAVHYISRSTFGYPQSLGCVEAPYNAAEQAWPYLQVGTLVTVAG